MSDTHILVINSGSSSLRFSVYDMRGERQIADGKIEQIGEGAAGPADHRAALAQALAGIADRDASGAVGHRVVHGGEAFSETVIIDDKVQKAVEEHIQLAPLHNPPNLLGIKVARELLPNVPQVAVFDTAYHQTMPAYAFTYPIPYELYEQLRVRRYGFHGTSHRYVAARAAKILGRKLEETNLITAHLGNGASMTAIQNGKSIDTTMGLTPMEGLIMGTRCGDIDPAIIAFLARVKDMPVAQIDNLLNKKSGMLGVSGLSNDMRSVEQAANEGNTRAALALEMYCYRIKKYVGAYTAAIGNVHALVFTAGVGENSDVVRERVCSNLQNIGYKIDVEKNRGVRGKELDIATTDSPIRILIIPTNEELMIAQDTYALTAKK